MRKLLMLIACALAITAYKPGDKITVFTIGDSTMADKDYSGGKQERGWGMMLQYCFSDKIVVDNRALNGRSSKSFINEGRWQAVLDKLKPGDYVFIQFGHNDEKPKPDRHTDPGTTFDANLRRFVEETRAKGAHPVLFSCVVRRNFVKTAPKNDDDEALRKTVGVNVAVGTEETDTLYDTHGDYRFSPRDVARETGAPFVDANKITHDLEQGLGREGSKKLHMIFAPGETPSLPEGRHDNTHYSIAGAITVAGLLADAVAEEVPALKKHIRHYDLTVDKTGRGRYFSLDEAVAAAPAGKRATIAVGPGEWTKPAVPKGKRIKFILRDGASWKK